jgi:hypothetical protein
MVSQLPELLWITRLLEASSSCTMHAVERR